MRTELYYVTITPDRPQDGVREVHLTIRAQDVMKAIEKAYHYAIKESFHMAGVKVVRAPAQQELRRAD